MAGPPHPPAFFAFPGGGLPNIVVIHFLRPHPFWFFLPSHPLLQAAPPFLSFCSPYGDHSDTVFGTSPHRPIRPAGSVLLRFPPIVRRMSFFKKITLYFVNLRSLLYEPLFRPYHRKPRSVFGFFFFFFADLFPPPAIFLRCLEVPQVETSALGALSAESFPEAALPTCVPHQEFLVLERPCSLDFPFRLFSSGCRGLLSSQNWSYSLAEPPPAPPWQRMILFARAPSLSSTSASLGLWPRVRG